MKNNTEFKISNLHIQRNYPLDKSNSWKVGGAADFFCQPKNQEDILCGLEWAETQNIPVTLLGQGSNVLISDNGVAGLVMGCQKLKTIHTWEQNNRLYIKALTGASKAEIMQIFFKYNLSPALFLCGLPGDIGGGVVMNAGVGQLSLFPKEFKDIVDWIKVIRKQKVVLVKSAEIQWGYRMSQGWQPGVIYEIGMSWNLKPLPDLPFRLREMALKRTQTQPLKNPTCGSVFKNPSTIKTSGALIEQCGLKGYQIGQACISKKHANFIINLGIATATDIHQLIKFIQEKVQSKYNILLETEVKYIGRW